MSHKKYLVHVDILGFGPITKRIAENQGREVAGIREDFKRIIYNKIKEARKEISLNIISTGADDWTLSIDSKKDVFFVMSKILNHYTGYKEDKNVPLEIAIGTAEYKNWVDENKLINQNETIEYLKSGLITKYKRWYKAKNNVKYVEETFIVIENSFFNELSFFDQKECYKIPQDDLDFYYMPKTLIERERKIADFFEKIKQERSDFAGALIDRVFIPPDGYEKIQKTLEKDRIVFITGTAGYGKTYTAIKLLWEYYKKNYIPCWISGKDELERSNVRNKLANIETQLDPHHVLYFEDPFGKTKIERRDDLKERINYILNAVKNKEDVYVIITSRKDVFEEFEKESYSIEEIKKFEQELNLLQPAYNLKKRKKILKDWAVEKNCKWLENEELKNFVFKSLENKDTLPTPLNIYDFVEATRKTENKKELKEKLISYSKNAAKAFSDEIIGLYESERRDRVLFLSLIFISEAFEVDFIKEEYEKMRKEDFEDFEKILEEEYRVKGRLFKNREYLEFSHPSYFESINYTLENSACKKIFLDVSKNLLNHDESSVQWRTAEALGKIGNPQTLNLLIETLEDKNWSVRRASAWALGELRDPKAVESLINSSNDSDFGVRMASIRALGEIGDPKAIKFLIEKLNGMDFSARKASAKALGEIGDLKAVPYLIKLLKDPDWVTQSKAAEALGKIGHPKAVLPLIETLKDPNEIVYDKTVKALERIGEPSFKPLIKPLKGYDWSNQHLIGETLKKIGKPMVPYLIKFLKDKDSCVKTASLHALIIIKDSKAVMPIIETLKDENWTVRKVGAETLREIKDSRAVLPLIELLKDEKLSVKRAVIVTLGELKDSRAVLPLIELLKDEKLSTHQITDALKEIKSPETIKILIELLKDRDMTIRISAVRALGEMGDSKSILPLIELLKDTQDSIVKKGAIQTLGKIGNPLAIKPLIEIIRDPDPDVRISCVEALGSIKDPSAVVTLIEALKDLDPYVQNETIWALVKIGDQRAVQPIIELLEGDLDPNVYEETILNLEQIGDPEMVQPIVKAFKEKFGDPSLIFDEFEDSFDEDPFDKLEDPIYEY